MAGPNGSGKSTIIKALIEGTDCDIDFSGSTERYLFDTEKMNSRILSKPAITPKEMALRIRGSFSSHGQTLQQQILSLPANKQGVTLFIDEPETGQDFSSVKKIKKFLEIGCSKGYQIIIASHHPVFWKNTNLIELEKKYTETVIKQIALTLTNKDSF